MKIVERALAAETEAAHMLRGPHSFVISFLLFGSAFTASSCVPVPKLGLLTALPIRRSYPEASAAALSWQPDADFMGAEWTLAGGEPSVRRIAYEFRSPSANAFFLAIVTTQGLRTIQGVWPAGRPFGEPISLDALNLQSQEALDIVIEQGGAGFAERNGTYGDYVFLRLTRLDEYASSGPIVWVGGFTNTAPQAQLYVTIDDQTARLVNIKAYGKKEQTHWLRELAQQERLNVGDSAGFFDYFTLTLDGINYDLGRRSAHITIVSPEASFLIRGIISYPDVKEDSPFYFGDYVVQLNEIGEDWTIVEVMPLTRWFVSPPNDSHD